MSTRPYTSKDTQASIGCLFLILFSVIAFLLGVLVGMFV